MDGSDPISRQRSSAARVVTNELITTLQYVMPPPMPPFQKRNVKKPP